MVPGHLRAARNLTCTRTLQTDETATDRLSVATLTTYGLPWIGTSFISFFLTLYFFKFATDTLLIAPAAMGIIYAAARIWDAISDPMVGFLSDRTQTRAGRRRPWFFASVVPMALIPVLLWSPPAFLSGNGLVLWVIVFILAYETVLTMYLIPGMALGAELSTNYDERTRVFGYRQACWSVGFLLCVGAVYLLTSADDKHETARWLALTGGGIAALTIAIGAWRIKESPTNQGRGGRNPLRVVGDVWRNPHARLLVLVLAVESLGMATLGVLSPYVMQYVVGSEQAYAALMLSYFVPSMLVIPVAVWLSTRLGKPRLWVIAIFISSISFGAFYFTGHGDLAYVLMWSIGCGVGTGISAVVVPSMQADVVDYDELVTGERKEGSYFALWNLLRKAAAGLVGAMAGIVLHAVGFEPNVEQTELTKKALLLMFGAWPAALTGVGGIVFLMYFRLDRAAHDEIIRQLDARDGSSRNMR